MLDCRSLLADSRVSVEATVSPASSNKLRTDNREQITRRLAPSAHAPPREAKPFTRITRRCRAALLALAPSSVPLIGSHPCAAFIEKSALTAGGSLPQS